MRGNSKNTTPKSINPNRVIRNTIIRQPKVGLQEIMKNETILIKNFKGEV